MTLMKTLLYSLWLSINIIVVGLTAYHLIKLEKEIKEMAIYNSTHTGQEIDNAVNRINNIKLFRYDIKTNLIALNGNTYIADFGFYSSNENIGTSLTDIMNNIFGVENVSKYYFNTFQLKEIGNDVFLKGVGIFKQYDDFLKNTYYYIIPEDVNNLNEYIEISRTENINIYKTRIM